MPPFRLLFIYFLFSTTLLLGQSQSLLQKASSDAYLITRMADKFHVKPKVVNEEFSSEVYKEVLKRMDNSRLLLTKEDLNKLEPYRYSLHKEILGKKTGFLQLIINIYSERLQQADTMAENILKLPFKYSIAERYTVIEDSTHTENVAAMRLKLYKKLKYTVASNVALVVKDCKDPIKQKKLIDSADNLFRKKTLNAFRLTIQKEQQSPGGIPQLICNDYCKSIAGIYDPHSAYMTITDRENFEGQIGKKNMVFGFNLEEDEEGNISINNLQPGSAAFKSGRLNKGDKIIAIQWEGAKPIDVSKASAEEIADILEQNNHAKATLTIVKQDGTKRQVELAKEKETEDAGDNKVKSYLLKGDKTIGYISLPSFYEDWEDKVSINGCANDVAKEILKLKKENIDGLVLDLRYNGGGSVNEAVDLAGIFIDAGPIAQIKTREAKPFTLKDMNRGTIFDGPITLLVNGFSASASELLAGALQDYNRALIIGSPTYGKATGQRILPLDTTIDLHKEIVDTTSPSFLKLTLMQVYQVSGNTAQFKGVIPDIILPDATDAYDKKEKNEPFAIPANKTDANKYYIACKPLPLSMLQEKAIVYKNEEPYFKTISEYINQKKIKPAKKDVSLKMEDIIKNLPKDSTLDEEDDDDTLEFNEIKKEHQLYSIQLNKYETERIATNNELKKIEDTYCGYLAKDPYLRVAYRLMLLMNK